MVDAAPMQDVHRQLPGREEASAEKWQLNTAPCGGQMLRSSTSEVARIPMRGSHSDARDLGGRDTRATPLDIPPHSVTIKVRIPTSALNVLPAEDSAMRTLDRKPNTARQPSGSAHPVPARLGHTARRNALLRLQHTIGNQAVARSGLAPVQRNGGAYVYIRQLQARQLYDQFVRNAQRYGLPVRFLRRVGRDYSISFGSSSAVNYWLNTMTLEESDLRSASQMAPTLPVGEASAIRTIYEEATHAYLDLVSDEPRFRRFITAGEQHYQGAPTARGTTTTDPGRVFQEAAANYVAHRAATWWSTFESLSIHAAGARANPAYARRLQERNVLAQLQADYNRRMGEVVFGYSEEGGFLGIGSEQVETTRAMSRRMKTFLDRDLLEGRIPDRFGAVAGFQQLLAQAGGASSRPAPTP
jgi:hypothetical protein